MPAARISTPLMPSRYRASSNNVFVYVPNGANFNVATFNGNFMTAGAVNIGSPDVINGRVLTQGQITISNFNNGTAVFDQGGVTPEPSTWGFSGIAGVFF